MKLTEVISDILGASWRAILQALVAGETDPELVQIAWPACRKKHSYFQAQFLRLKSRRGPKKAIVAVAASMLTAMYYMLRDGAEFRELGDQHITQCDKTRMTNRLLQRLRDLGVEVEVKAA